MANGWCDFDLYAYLTRIHNSYKYRYSNHSMFIESSPSTVLLSYHIIIDSIGSLFSITLSARPKYVPSTEEQQAWRYPRHHSIPPPQRNLAGRTCLHSRKCAWKVLFAHWWRLRVYYCQRLRVFEVFLPPHYLGRREMWITYVGQIRHRGWFLGV